jgi:hypothetical protein
MLLSTSTFPALLDGTVFGVEESTAVIAVGEAGQDRFRLLVLKLTGAVYEAVDSEALVSTGPNTRIEF